MSRWSQIAAALALAFLPALGRAGEASRVGREVAPFRLNDHHGRPHDWSTLAEGKKAVVVAFLGVECPLAKLYAPRLQELAARYESQGVAFVGVCSNRQDAPTEIEGYVTQHGIKFPVLKDHDNVVADDFQAQRTPEVYLVVDGAIRYAGRIDDQYGLGNGSGYAKSAIHRRDLVEAIEEVLAGKPVSVPQTEAPGCIIGRVSKVAPHGEITYANQVARILQDRCVECHRPGEVAPFALTSYDEVVGWAEMIREVVDEQRMPPWFADPKYGHFANDRRLGEDEKQTLRAWVANGCPEGDPRDLPEPRAFVDGWQIGEPDAVFYASDEPVDVPAEGVMDYQYLTIDPGFTEDKWIQAAEARPGNRQVVHHIIVFFEQGGGRRGGGMRDGGQIGYAPGMQPRVFAPGEAIKVSAGSKITFQMHYTPNGSPQTDRSCVGFKFADPKSVVRQVNGNVVGNMSFKIPPFAADHPVTATKKFRRDTLLLSMLPHMHLRGKSFRFELTYPDGNKEVLLDVPEYDFNWQLWYQLAEPKLIPKGSKMTAYATFDNSADNPFNPDPGSTVTWGEQTFEEMMFGFFTTVDPNQNLQKAPSAEVERDDDDLSEKAAF